MTLDKLKIAMDKWFSNPQNLIDFEKKMEEMSNSDLDHLPWEMRKEYCYCKKEEDHCGTCSCGKSGHMRSMGMGTDTWCDECYQIDSKRILY